eukprot:TRINITY_DN8660_c0_g1_i1.p1 TRINITY_DN8660_c0_g1~~TRINITY_DN8660_c0_g1_i1.p1  ORF type:complete len:572 (+),score=163.99 TRINITY_DN8660_c0_g1_i1:75-1718(+)
MAADTGGDPHELEHVHHVAFHDSPLRSPTSPTGLQEFPSSFSRSVMEDPTRYADGASSFRASVTANVVSAISISFMGEQATAGVCVVALSLFMTIIGTGVLSMPAAAARLGTVGFPLALTVSAALFWFSILLTARNLDLCGMRRGRNMAEVGRAALGKPGFALAVFLCFADNWGALMGSFRVIGDLMNVLGPRWLTGPAAILGSCALAFPLTLPGTMQGAQLSTVIAASAVAFLGVLLITQAFESPDAGRHLRAQPRLLANLSALRALPVVVYGFDCQTVVYPLFREFDAPRPKGGQFGWVGLWSCGAAAFIYWACGTSGLGTYGPEVPGNVLAAMPPGIAVRLCQGAVTLSTFCLLPITAFELTVLLRQYVFSSALLGPRVSIALSNLLCMSTSALAACAVSNAYQAFAIVGAVAVTSLTFILPPLFFLCLTSHPDAHRPRPPHSLQGLPVVASVPAMEDGGSWGAASAPGGDDPEKVPLVHGQSQPGSTRRSRLVLPAAQLGTGARTPRTPRGSPARAAERAAAWALLFSGTVLMPTLLWAAVWS